MHREIISHAVFCRHNRHDHLQHPSCLPGSYVLRKDNIPHRSFNDHRRRNTQEKKRAEGVHGRASRINV